MIKSIFILSALCVYATGQRVTTIQLDGVQYYVSRMNPYSPELNYFLAYQYCRSLGLQLASFETKEKYNSITNYLTNAGYQTYDFWTSGNKLGTDMYLWMSTGLPFNATFNFFEKKQSDEPDLNGNTAPQRTARDDRKKGQENSCVILKSPSLKWKAEDCALVKDFICEQTRCYYYNYGSIPVSSAQGRSRATTESSETVSTTTTAAPEILKHSEATSLYHSLSSTNAPIDRDSTEDLKNEEDVNATDEIQTNAVTEEEADSETPAEDTQHEEEEENEEVAVEDKIKELTEETGYQNNERTDSSDDPQSFLTLSDLIKTLQPAIKNAPQIDSSYSHTMRVLGEQSSVLTNDNDKNVASQTNRALFK